MALCQPTPEISVTKFPADKQKNKQVRQLTRLEYIPHADRRYRPVCDLDLKPLKVIQSEAYGSNTVTVAVLDIFYVKKYDLDF